MGVFILIGVALTPEEELEQAKKIRKINHGNTRFDPRELAAMNMSMMKSKSDQAGATAAGGSSSLTTINRIAKVGIDGKEDVKETPKIGGYSLVDMTPSPMPGRSLGDESPAMVWGEIESTPFRLDPGMTPYTGKLYMTKYAC